MPDHQSTDPSQWAITGYNEQVAWTTLERAGTVKMAYTGRRPVFTRQLHAYVCRRSCNIHIHLNGDVWKMSLGNKNTTRKKTLTGRNLRQALATPLRCWSHAHMPATTGCLSANAADGRMLTNKPTNQTSEPNNEQTNQQKRDRPQHPLDKYSNDRSRCAPVNARFISIRQGSLFGILLVTN